MSAIELMRNGGYGKYRPERMAAFGSPDLQPECPTLGVSGMGGFGKESRPSAIGKVNGVKRRRLAQRAFPPKIAICATATRARPWVTSAQLAFTSTAPLFAGREWRV